MPVTRMSMGEETDLRRTHRYGGLYRRVKGLIALEETR